MADATPIPPETPVQPAKTRRPSKLGRVLLVIAGLVLAVFIGIQFIPVSHTNPPVTAQINWDSPQTEALAKQACMNCHSNETTWPWYSYVAPVSWLVHYDVTRGRNEFNLSTYGATGQQGFEGGAFAQANNDLAYRLGQFLAGGGQGERPEGFSNGQFPNRQEGNGQFPTFQPGQFPTREPGQQPPSGQLGRGGFGGGLANRLTEVIQNNQMPPSYYLLMHPEADLTADERQQLLQGLLASLGLSGQ